MSDTYVECMVTRKTSGAMTTLKYILIAMCCFFVFFAFGTQSAIAFILAILFGVGVYFVNMQCNIEYEYLYLDKEITIDKVINKAKRKRVATFELEKMEVIAPIKSHQLDSYNNRSAKTSDYSSGIEGQPDRRFVFFYNGTEKVIIEPSPELMKVLKSVAPRKVFLD